MSVSKKGGRNVIVFKGRYASLAHIMHILQLFPEIISIAVKVNKISEYRSANMFTFP